MISNFNDIVIFDYNCIDNTILLLNNITFNSTEYNLELTFDYTNVNYLFFRTLSNKISNSIVFEYKKDIRLVTPTGFVILYNAWLSELNYTDDVSISITLMYDYIEYHSDKNIFNNYTTHIRNYKLQKIKKKMKK